MNYLTFNGQNLRDFDVMISGEGTYNAPTRAVEEQIVPGRNGTLLIDGGRFENIVVTYPAFVPSIDSLAQLRSYLLSVVGYARLTDSYHPDEYRLASFVDGITVDTSGRHNAHGQFDLAFNCKPQRFLISGETTQTFTEDGMLTNPTLYDAKPLIRIYGTGTVGIGEVNVTFDGSTPYVDLDCDIQDAFYQTANKNSSVTFSPNRFPTLGPGSSGVVLGSGITQVEITPRWWKV